MKAGRHRSSRRGSICAGLIGAAAITAQAQTAIQQVEIIGTSPLPGQGVDRDALPYTTQLLRRSAIDAAGAGNTTDLLARRLPGVQVNELQGSPFQADLTFRGFRASGLIGAAQGLSVYLDGVRINEPFGDIVNWDMLPEYAVDSVALVPGANPAYGLNTLGGALSLTTADGRSAPGLRGEASAGSFGRRRASASIGGAGETWSHYLGVGLFEEDGWRAHSAGHLGSVFGKLGLSSALGEFSLSLLAARSRLVGNGLVPLFSFDESNGSRTPDIGALQRNAVYTHPDITRNRVTQITGRWRYTVDAESTAEAVLYGRNSRRASTNGDAADDDSSAQAALNDTSTRQQATGAALALSSRSGNHQWQVGVNLDRARMSYLQNAQAAVFDATRGVIALEEAPAFDASVSGRSTALAAFATDTWKLAPATHLTATLRASQTRVRNTLTSVDDDSGDIEAHAPESFTYRSLNPALGMTHRLSAGFTLFANAARNTRVPTVIELGCANPAEPCRLPAGLQSDPYLEQVKSTTLEGGARFGNAGGHGGSITLFRSDNRNDILFSSVSVAGQQGYFRNFDRTRHAGLDAEWHATLGPLALSASYSRLHATYRSAGLLRIGERNLAVQAGTPIAGLPRHMLKLALDWTPAAGWTLGADMQALSRRIVAGNEDGLVSDGASQTVDLSLPGMAIVNLRASWRPVALPGVEWFVRAANIFDRRGASYGAIAQTVFDAGGAYTGSGTPALFVAPTTPRALSAGLRINF